MLHYGDAKEDTDNPTVEMLQNKSEWKLACLYLLWVIS